MLTFYVVSGFLSAAAAALTLVAYESSDLAQVFCLLPACWTCSRNQEQHGGASPLLGKYSVEPTLGDVISLQFCPTRGHGAVPRKAWLASQASLSNLGHCGQEGHLNHLPAPQFTKQLRHREEEGEGLT